VFSKIKSSFPNIGISSDIFIVPSERWFSFIFVSAIISKSPKLFPSRVNLISGILIMFLSESKFDSEKEIINRNNIKISF